MSRMEKCPVHFENTSDIYKNAFTVYQIGSILLIMRLFVLKLTLKIPDR